MSTDLKDLGGSSLTPEEAEAIFELWAKRQADTEALRSRLSVHEMAEAMSISPAEVEGMLTAVRAQKTAPVPMAPVVPLKKVKPVNTFLIALAAVGWLAFLIFAGYAAASSERRAEVVYGGPTLASPPPVPFTDVAEVATAAAPAPINDIGHIAGTYSGSLTVGFDGATFQGNATSGQKLLPMETLQTIVDNIAPAPSAQTSTTLSDADIIQIFQENGKSKLGADVIAFKEMTLKAGSQTITKQIPVSLTQEERVSRLVREEQARRLRIFTNEAGQKLNF